jgi:hypothetical protein
LELEEIKLKDFLKKKETGSLLVNAKQKQLEESLQQVQLSETPDGMLHFGNKVLLINHQSEAFMCANPHDAIHKAQTAFALTTGPNSNACVRNCFELERADPNDGFDDDVIHYGQNFRFKMESFSKITQPVYMYSEMLSPLAASKFSRHQEVVVYPEKTGQTLWQVLYPDTQVRFEMEGKEVPAGAPVVFRHAHTGSFLASDKINYNNIFGLEYEVHCHPYFSTNKTQNLASEKKGDITGDYALRRHGLANIWTVVTATSIAAALDE